MFPEKFNNKTNGIAHTDAGDTKRIQIYQRLLPILLVLHGMNSPNESLQLLKYQDDSSFLEQLLKIKKENKHRLAEVIQSQNGIMIDSSAIFDVHVKRLHAYKRQLLKVLHIMYPYTRIKEDSSFSMVPRVFIFGAKASPGYYYAKKLLNSLIQWRRRLIMIHLLVRK